MFSTFKTKLAAYIEKLLALATPVGTCIFAMGTEIPEGFLAVNGQKVYQNVHPRLYAVLSPLTQLSKGTDSTGAYVTLPNADGRVLQGTNSATSVGQLLNASLPNIRGNFLARSGVGFGGQPADSGIIYPDSTELTRTIQYINDDVNLGTSLRISASRSSSVYADNAGLQVPASLCLVAIRY